MSLDSKMSLPLSLSGPPKLIFSERLTTVKTVDFPMDPTERSRSFWTGRQALTLLIFLPSLQSVSLGFEFSYKDVSVINTHLPTLIESGRAVSRVKKLSLKFYQHFPAQGYHYDSTLIVFLSIFKSLENLSLTFIEDSRMNVPSVSQPFEFPTNDLIKGLIGSSATLRSLSVEGQDKGPAEEKAARDERFWSTLRRFKKLEHLRFDANAFFGTAASQNGVYIGPDIKSLELANNFSDWRLQQSGGNAELFFWPMLESGMLPKSLKLIRSPRRPLDRLDQAPPADLENGDQFYRARKKFMETAAKSGVVVEFYD